MIKLSILIPTILGRECQYEALRKCLESQYSGHEVEICTLKDNKEMTVGEKRNKLMEMANGEYICFIDDDDSVIEKYIQLIMEGIDKGVDCCSLKGIITFDGKDPQYFEHSMKYDKYETIEGVDFNKGGIKYLRHQNHLNAIRSDIAKQFTFPHKNHSEDTDWAVKVHESGLLKTEHYIPEVIYYYNYISNK